MTYPVVKAWLHMEALDRKIVEALERLRWHYPGLVITSIDEQLEGRRIDSRHYQGFAVDLALETRHGVQVDETKLVEICGKDFQAVGPVKDPKGHKDHIHFEYDPQGEGS